MTTTSSNTQIVLASRPAGEPQPENFSVVHAEPAQLGEGDVLLQTLWISLDPYMRLRMDDRPSYAPPVAIGQPMVAGGVGRVLQSRSPLFKVGDLVEGRTGWQSHPVLSAASLRAVSGTAQESRQALSLFGIPALSAYVGLLHIGKLQPGETVVVGAATGAVGSIVGQIAKLHGCRVVGIAGGQDKCRIAVNEFGFDACVDHRGADLAASLARACPEGVDVYFENVGGAVLQAVLPLLNLNARIPLCGLVAQYNSDRAVDAGGNLALFLDRMLARRVMLRGFITVDHLDLRPQFEADMTLWIREGRMHYREDITEGLENAPGALVRMLRGELRGKALVKVAD